MSNGLVVEDLWKSYDEVQALRGVSFEVGPGEIFGLIGPNGAGKTTTLRIVAGLLRPDRGRVEFQGLDPWSGGEEYRRLISYLPEEAGVYKHLTGLETLRFLAELYASSREEVEEMVRYGARLSGLGDALRRPAGTYSKGMKRRLLLAATLMTRPRLAILDEPTSGLDVYHSVEMRRIVKSYATETGATVLLSSHNMLEVEYLCTRVAFIAEGRIIDQGAPGELVEKYGAENLEDAFVRAVTRWTP